MLIILSHIGDAQCDYSYLYVCVYALDIFVVIVHFDDLCRHNFLYFLRDTLKRYFLLKTSLEYTIRGAGKWRHISMQERPQCILFYLLHHVPSNILHRSGVIKLGVFCFVPFIFEHGLLTNVRANGRPNLA